MGKEDIQVDVKEEVKEGVTATIKNVAKESNGYVVFASFSDGDERSYHFSQEQSDEEVIKTIKVDVDYKNSVQAKVDSVSKSLIGQVIS